MKHCKTPFCRKKADRGNYCYKCEKAKWRAANPMRAAFQNLRNNSKRRGKEFTLTFEQFSAFCYKTKYLAGRGRALDNYTIDRIDNSKGYTAENIRVMTNKENASKGKKLLVYDYRTGHAAVI